MDFFAIVAGYSHVFRMDLKKDIQEELSAEFEAHANALLDNSLKVIPFKRENFYPDETEILEITPYDLPDYIFDAVNNPAGCPVLKNNDEELGKVYCVFGYNSSADRAIFQVIQKSQRLSRKFISLILSGDCFDRLVEPGLILNYSCHAVCDRNSLRFRSLWWLKQIVDISTFYSQATEADLDALAADPNVYVENLAKLKQSSGQWIRTRVAYIIDSGILSNTSPDKLLTLASDFGVSLQTKEIDGIRKLIIPEDPRELRSILKFLEEEYYQGLITGAKYETNSKRKMS